EAKRLADEGASKLLDERNAQLAAVNARLQAIEAKEMERAAKLLDRVPEGLRAQLEAFKGDMPTEKWVALVEASAQPAGTPTPPAMGSGGDRGANGQHQASSGTMEVLDSLGAEPKALGLVKLAKESDPDSGAMLTKFTIPIKTMMRTLRKYDPIPVTLESARERGGKR
ncbi:MAG TPA: hypothetical protein VJ787_06745, partial [Thermoleophilia bacterium]|nr:hypothetical protein [Thermoleophilia bacterium]